jgi:hypothetical protein
MLEILKLWENCYLIILSITSWNWKFQGVTRSYENVHSTWHFPAQVTEFTKVTKSPKFQGWKVFTRFLIIFTWQDVARVFTPEENAIHDAKRWINGRLHAMQEINIDEVIVISPEKQAIITRPQSPCTLRQHPLSPLYVPPGSRQPTSRADLPLSIGVSWPRQDLYYISKSLFIAKLNKYWHRHF